LFFCHVFTFLLPIVARLHSRVDATFDYEQNQLDDIDFPSIRLLYVRRVTAASPQNDIALEHSWLASNAINGDFVRGFSAVCYFYGREVAKRLGGAVPIGLIHSSWEGTQIEPWMSHEALVQCRTTATDDEKLVHDHASSEEPWNVTLGGRSSLPDPNDDSVLYNAMIHPLLPLSIRTVLWYQGEANAGNPPFYARAQPAMIRDWRVSFQDSPQISFFYVQLAAYNFRQGWGDFRWYGQTLSLDAVQPGGQAIAIDGADPGMLLHLPHLFASRFYPCLPSRRHSPSLSLSLYWVHHLSNVPLFFCKYLPCPIVNRLAPAVSPYNAIHPRGKLPIAERLERIAAVVEYGFDVTHEGPAAQHVWRHSSAGGVDSYTVSFDEEGYFIDPNGCSACCARGWVFEGLVGNAWRSMVTVNSNIPSKDVVLTISNKRVSATDYESSVGFCRGGLNYPGETHIWKCLGQRSFDGCQLECDSDPNCFAFDRGDTSSQSSCCLFGRGNSGNGDASMRCYTKPVEDDGVVSSIRYAWAQLPECLIMSTTSGLPAAPFLMGVSLTPPPTFPPTPHPPTPPPTPPPPTYAPTLFPTAPPTTCSGAWESCGGGQDPCCNGHACMGSTWDLMCYPTS
jgi:hypothetical protein